MLTLQRVRQAPPGQQVALTFIEFELGKWQGTSAARSVAAAF